MPPDPAYPATLNSLGDHLRKRRLDLRLLQREVGRLLGVDAGSVTNWEVGRTVPEFRWLPKIIRFLGYDPRPAAETIGATLIRHRQGQGMSQKTLAAMPQGRPGYVGTVGTRGTKTDR